MHVRRLLVWLVALAVVISGSLAVWTLRSPLSLAWHLVQSSLKPEPTVRFAVIGDSHGVNPIYQQALKDMADDHISFLLHLADNTEDGTAAEFNADVALEKQSHFPVYHTVGNHDIKSDDSRSLFTQSFGEAPDHAIDQGQVHLVVLDNADRHVGFSQGTLNWLSADLAAHKNQVLMIAYHRPFGLPLATILGDDETTTSSANNKKFLDIIRAYNVKYIFTAHVHTYLQYTLQGVPAVISGGGGDPAQAVLGGPSANFFHYLIVTVRGSDVSVEMRRLQLQT